MDEGLLIARLAFGLLLAAHGAQKLLGWFGGYGIEGTAGFFESLGFRPGKPFTIAAGISEVGGGLLLALGFLQPLAAALVVSVMIVAVVSVHWHNGLLATGNGIELPLLYGVTAVALALTGPGVYSVDAAAGLTAVWTPALTLGLLGLGVLGAFGNLALRRAVPATA